MALKRVTVMLLKEVSTWDDAINPARIDSYIPTRASSEVNGRFYFARSHSHPPAWVPEVDLILSQPIDSVFSASSSGVLIVNTSGRYFAVTFGYGRSLLALNKVVNHFGLKVVLNRINPAQIRSMDTKTFEDLVVSRTTQASKNTDLPTFGVDVNRDILRAVAGKSGDESLGRRLAGSDAIVLSVNIEARELPQLCDRLLAAFEDDAYKANFEWIDHLELVEDPPVVDRLDALVVEQLRNGDTSKSTLATPEPIEWEDIEGFTIGGTRTTRYEDLDLDEYLSALGPSKVDITVERLKSRPVRAYYTRSGNSDVLWSAYQCLVSEQRFDDKLHVLIEGSWFAISDRLVDQVDDFVNALPNDVSALTNATPGETEPDYNLRMASENPGELLLLDARIHRPGGASSGIEICDLLSTDGTLIHVKRKSRSATLSHLFAQGTVSATSLVGDGFFRREARSAIEAAASGSADPWLSLIPDEDTPLPPDSLRVAYVVLAADTGASGTDWLPFFSKLNLMQHGRQLLNLRFGVSIARLDN